LDAHHEALADNGAGIVDRRPNRTRSCRPEDIVRTIVTTCVVHPHTRQQRAAEFIGNPRACHTLLMLPENRFSFSFRPEAFAVSWLE
jgi:hypothetical protein